MSQRGRRCAFHSGAPQLQAERLAVGRQFGHAAVLGVEHFGQQGRRILQQDGEIGRRDRPAANGHNGLLPEEQIALPLLVGGRFRLRQARLGVVPRVEFPCRTVHRRSYRSICLASRRIRGHHRRGILPFVQERAVAAVALGLAQSRFGPGKQRLRRVLGVAAATAQLMVTRMSEPRQRKRTSSIACRMRSATLIAERRSTSGNSRKKHCPANRATAPSARCSTSRNCPIAQEDLVAHLAAERFVELREAVNVDHRHAQFAARDADRVSTTRQSRLESGAVENARERVPVQGRIDLCEPLFVAGDFRQCGTDRVAQAMVDVQQLAGFADHPAAAGLQVAAAIEALNGIGAAANLVVLARHRLPHVFANPVKLGAVLVQIIEALLHLFAPPQVLVGGGHEGSSRHASIAAASAMPACARSASSARVNCPW